MEKLNRDRFIFAFQGPFGPLNESQTEGLICILTAMEADKSVTDLRHAAYMLATAWHETAKTLQPIAEYGKGTGKKYGLPAANGKMFYGRGYVQLTWAENYQAMGQALGVDLYNNPDLAMNPEIAYKIMSRGMRKGSFTGVKLSTYIIGEMCDYKGARKIINGMDQAERIAEYAVKIEKALRDAGEVSIA